MANTYKHLGQAGLEQLLQLLNTQFGLKVDKVEGKALSTNDFTNELKTKLEGIAEGANAYVHDTFTAKDLALYKVQVNGEGHVSNVEAVTKDDITALGIPGQDTTYVVATQTADGLMSAADKAKLDGVAEGANKYVHATHTAYDSGFYKVTVDAEGHVIAATAVTKEDVVALGIPAQDTTYVEATQSAAGLMSAADKKKVDEVAAGAQVNVIEEIQVNGTAQTINGKSVNIAVPTGALASKDVVAEADLDEALKTKVNASATASHTHKNFDLLETYTQTEADLADAVAKKHAHANIDELNKIADGDKAKWDKAVEDLSGEITRAKAAEEANATAAANAQTTANEAKAAAATNAENITKGDEATLASAKEYADGKIAAQISSAYKAAGSSTYEALPAPAAENEGYVYNITNDFTTDEDFVEGAGNSYKAGTNVVIIEVDGTYMYDVLAMSFDGFVQEANVSEFTSTEIDTMWNSVFTA